MYTVKIKCTYHTDEMLVALAMGVLISLIKVWLVLPQCHMTYHSVVFSFYSVASYTCANVCVRMSRDVPKIKCQEFLLQPAS